MDRELTKGTLSLLVLFLLRRKRMYGYELAATVREETDGAFQWKEGSLYPSLHKLEQQGLIRSEWEGPPGGRQRKYYDLTDAGRAALAEKVAAWRQLVRAMGKLLGDAGGSDERD